MYKNYEALKEARLDPNAPKKRIIVAGAVDEHALEAAFEAQKKGYVTPVLVGSKDSILELINKFGFENEVYEIVHCEPDTNPSSLAVQLVHEGRGDFILKGKLETKDLLKPVLDKKTGLNDNGFITHFGLMQIKGYHKLLAMSDSAVIPYPTLEDKVKIVKICMDMLRKLGYEKPVVGALCAVETVNPKMPETADAEALQNMSENGEFGNGAVVGPISYDLATRREAAAIKGYQSPYAGNVDMLLVPQMVTGNVMSKIWNADEDNILAGCLVGANVPIALTSRSASMNEKLYSILLCSLLSETK
ncbi:phosphate acyltransferase [Sinanaerobacter chloroacetimidivorans]|uniref:Phosphate butyryltransferase n=1 Tax=Sinanaerobacter chloroacetimidivorans TaxID=2818044 RepID=A0A8J7VZ48_9FIRM|nr:phosphate acyltransferase [Sinanaerobacter chloroacetimidivorans]MBR0597764.1 phosphate butyryltransferase [Sinanaerobacter chloroacetimidivorans]